jgi:drug/metabolite transporter (DMT)-like permease
MRILGILLLIVGEAIYSQDHPDFLAIFGKCTSVVVVSGGMIVAGYMLSYAAFKNIWIVSVISVTSILFLEPLLTYLFFHEMPGRGAAIGLVLGVLGFLSTLFM